MKTARDFMIEIPVLNCHDGITKARQILETTGSARYTSPGQKRTCWGMSISRMPCG